MPAFTSLTFLYRRQDKYKDDQARSSRANVCQDKSGATRCGPSDPGALLQEYIYLFSLEFFFFFPLTSWCQKLPFILLLSSVQFSRSVVSDSLRPMNCRTQGLPIHHQLPEFNQTHVHWISDAIQPSHPLSFPSSPAPNPSQHQSLFQWVNSLYEVAKVLELQLQHQSFQWTPRTDLL